MTPTDTSLFPVLATPQNLIPTALTNAPEQAQSAFFEFFAASIPNANTRESYLSDVGRFFIWCEQRGFDAMTVTPIHLSSCREDLRRNLSPPSVKRHFSSLRTLYDWVRS